MMITVVQQFIEECDIMGTRSMTKVFDAGVELLCIYKQYDGSPNSLGSDLANFLKDMELVNGIPVGSLKKMANGAGCLAAQLLSYLKTDVGGIYVYPVGSTDCGQEYEYHIHCDMHYDDTPNTITVGVVVENIKIFEGSVEEFEVFCKNSY